MARHTAQFVCVYIYTWTKFFFIGNNGPSFDQNNNNNNNGPSFLIINRCER